MRPLPAGAAIALALLAACGPGYESDIKKGSEALVSARTDAHRAAAHALRGGGYSEKARYLRAFLRRDTGGFEDGDGVRYSHTRRRGTAA